MKKRWLKRLLLCIGVLVLVPIVLVLLFALTAPLWQRKWIEPVYTTAYDNCGKPVVTCAQEGFFKDCFFPARYEDRYVKVWHAGYYR